MTALVAVETALLVVLAVLVAGLLRGYASVLSRLHQLDGGAAPSAAPPFKTVDSVPAPDPQRISGREEWAAAHDLNGVTLTDEIVSLRTVGVEHDTVLAFLSSGCEGCTGFWAELAETSSAFQGARLLVVTKDADAESPAALADLCPPGAELLMSSQAWTDYDVPGSPYVVVVDGRTGRVKGEGSGTSFSQVGGLIEQSVADLRQSNAVKKPAADRDREVDVDRVLLRAGIGPGDQSLYPAEPPR